MCKKLVILSAAYMLFLPILFSDMSSGGGMGASGQGAGGERQGRDNGQVIKHAVTAPVPTDNVNDILTLGDKLDLTNQQVVTIRIISADAQQETAEKSKTVIQCRQEFEKSLNQIKPDFAYPCHVKRID
jgi:hypothetical protein